MQIKLGYVEIFQLYHIAWATIINEINESLKAG